MNRNQFLQNQDVRLFVDWAARYLLKLKVHLVISRRGTGCANGKLGPGVNIQCHGLDDVTNAYQWRSEWSDQYDVAHISQDWPSTYHALDQLALWLNSEVNADSPQGTLKACRQIISWGGDRNANVGAYQFLQNVPNLPLYLMATKNQLDLAAADTAHLGKVGNMNAMLTKVHALHSHDGLPIFDSRVAGAIAAIVEIFRQNTHRNWLTVPSPLKFPATERRYHRNNGVRQRIFDREVAGLGNHYHPVNNVGVISNGPIKRALQWSSCKIRLGWLLEAIIQEADNRQESLFSPDTLGGGTMQRKMHAFEAALFMIGFNVACL